MKCKNLVKIGVKKLGSHSPNVLSIGHLSQAQQEEWFELSKRNINEFERCDGNLTASVKGYADCCYCEIEVRFECDRCKVNYHPYLPDENNIEEFLTKIVQEMPDD